MAEKRFSFPRGNWKLPPGKGHMDLPTNIYFQNMTMKDIEERVKQNDVIIIPLGSTECHGPNAPFGEDTFLVTRMAELVAERTGATVAQPLWYGSHPYHHVGMPGTVIVPEGTFIDIVEAMIAGFWNAGFRKQILFNGHGQEYVIPIAIHRFAKHFQVPAIIVNLQWYHAVPHHFKTKDEGGPYETPFIHADEVETSWSLALFPELMKQEHAVDTTPKGYLPEGHVDKAGNLLNRPIKWYGHVGLAPIEIYAYPEGVVGRATLADAKKAIKGVEDFLDYFVTLIEDILNAFPPGKLPSPEELSLKRPEELEPYLKYPWEEGWRPIYALAGYPW